MADVCDGKGHGSDLNFWMIVVTTLVSVILRVSNFLTEKEGEKLEISQRMWKMSLDLQILCGMEFGLEMLACV